MELRAIFSNRPEYELFPAPKPGESVWPHQGCPCWTARRYTLLADPDHECWCCAFADFHLERVKALEVGICQYPRKEDGTAVSVK